MRKHKTRSDAYGDGSNHLVCGECSFCIICRDYKNHGYKKDYKPLKL